MKVFNGCENLEVDLVSYTKDIFEIALRFGAVTYHQNDVKNKENLKKFIFDKILNNKTSPKILEAAHCAFVYKNISRINLARLTRDNCGAINSESSAIPVFNPDTGKIEKDYVEPNFIKPMSISADKELSDAYDDIVKAMQKFNEICTKNFSITHADRRYAFLQGETISIGIEYNFRQFQGMLNHRLIPAIGDEDFIAAAKAYYALYNQIQEDYKSGILTEENYMLWTMLLKKALPKVFFVDEMIGDQFNQGQKVVGDVPENPIYSKEKCQLYYELKRLLKENPDMLEKIEFKEIAENL